MISNSNNKCNNCHKINSIDLNNHINLNSYNKMIKKIETNTKRNNKVSFSNNFNMPSKTLTHIVKLIEIFITFKTLALGNG